MPATSESPLLRGWRKGWQPHDRRPIYEWARDHVRLTSAYAIPGPFQVEKSRYLIEPFHAIADDAVRIVTIRKGIQTGGSLLGDITVCHLICNRPQTLLWNFPTDEAADDYGARRAMPLLEACPPIAARFEKIHRHKKRKNQILFGPMFIALQGANLRNLQTFSVPTLINEELWEWDAGMYQQALGRVAFFSWRSKVLNISQAGEPGDDLDQEYLAGTQEVWHFSCPACRVDQPYLWSRRVASGNGPTAYAGMTWDTSNDTRPDGEWNFQKLKATVRYRCIHCGHEIRDTPTERRLLNDHGKFVAQNPNASHDKRSFHWNSLACDEVHWATLVEEYLRAKTQEKLGNSIPLREFWKKRMAEPFDIERHSAVDLLPTISIEINNPSEPLVHEGIPFIYRLAGVDVQFDHFWMLVQYWSAGADILNVWAGKLYSWEEIADRQKEFAVHSKDLLIDIGFRRHEVITQAVLHAQIEKVPDGRVASFPWKCLEDTAVNSFPHPVRARVPDGARRFVQLPYSGEQKADPCIGLRTTDPLRARLAGRRAPIYRWSAPWINEIVIRRRDAPEPKFLTLAGPWNQEFSDQMHSQKQVLVQDKMGQDQRKWKKFRADHLFNCAGMIAVRAFMLRIVGEPVPEGVGPSV